MAQHTRSRRPLALPLALVAPLVAGVAVAACTPADLVAPPAAGAAVQLEDFGSCEELLDYFQQHALAQVGPWGLGSHYGWGGSGPWPVDDAMLDAGVAGEAGDAGSEAAAVSDAGAGGDYSGTNNQSEGVEEPDLVQTDGEIIVTVSAGRLVVVDAASATRVGAVELPHRREGHSELLLDRETGRALVLTTEWTEWGGDGAAVDGATTWPAFPPQRTVLTLVDVTDPAAPSVLGGMRLEGGYRSARMHDGTARVVMVTEPPGLSFVQPRDGSLTAEEEATASNRRIIEESTLDAWLPHLQVLTGSGGGGTGSAATELAVPCTDVARPPEFSGLSTVSVLTLDLSGEPRPTSATGLVATGSTVYASADRLLVATSAWDARPVEAMTGADVRMEQPSTALHAFELGPDGRTDYLASGRVTGQLRNQFALDETDGVIRVATTLEATQEAPSSSSLVMLAEQGRELVQTGRVDDLGPTERIKAVRYLSPDLAAVVTFRETDPLYLVDTSDPTAPVVAGELKIPGYSTYLHPAGDGRLLGLGQDATEDGRTTGLQLSVFDVSNPGDPVRVSQVMWPDYYSGAEYDHRAFRHWTATGQVFLPVEVWSEHNSWTGVTSARLIGDQVHKGPELRVGGSDATGWEYASRTLVIDGLLWVLTDSTLRAVDLTTLEEHATVRL
ncbi:beta-propeller domain-containing protein [Ornithinimicrobium sufpigmenti]|uniref:beta-propeller domain-containing protein n=1 Tax=Ornithinimicrobium sufpigmenti TaxID=2508882 RepID=UPI0015E1887C|nr:MULTISPECIES: beta-propeller domain-containing protein [unclassified Ornithinimicrobium]